MKIIEFDGGRTFQFENRKEEMAFLKVSKVIKTLTEKDIENKTSKLKQLRKAWINLEHAGNTQISAISGMKREEIFNTEHND